ESELQKLPGFGRDAEKNRAEAKRLLAEAGYPNGFKVVLKNRNVRVPYIDFGVFVIQEWRKIGIEAEHRPLETAAWFADGRDTGSFELIVNGVFNHMDDPDLFLERYTTGDTNNWGRFSDPRIDDLFARQTRALDPAERKRLVNEIEKIVLENAYHIPGLWWARSVVHWAKVKNYVAPPRAAAPRCSLTSAPPRRASTRIRRAPSRRSNWWPRSTARCCRRTPTATQRSSGTPPASGKSRRTR